MRKISLPKMGSMVVLAGVLALGACGKKHEEPPVENEEVFEEPGNVTEVTPPPMPEVPVETNNAAPVQNRVAPPEISDEQQLQDDAEATGMTSRLPDDEGASTATGGAQ